MNTTNNTLSLSLKEKEQMIIQARKWIMVHDKSMAGVMTYAECMILDVNQSQIEVAATDGSVIYIADGFFSLKPVRERAAVIVHEVLHVCFRHPQRRGTRHSQLWNIAVDAVVNAGILRLQKWLTLPADTVTFEKIIDPQTRSTKPDADWTSEAVYEYLVHQAKERLQEILNDLKSGKGNKDDIREGDSKVGRGSYNSDPTLEELMDQIAEEIRKKYPTAGRDLLTPKPKKGDNTDLEERTWESRLTRTMAGAEPNSVLAQLLNEFPKSEIPYQVLLRQYMRTACLPKTRDNWSRPGRQMLSSTSNKIFIPGIKQQDGLQRAVVIVDTSGSIYVNPKALNAFAAEVTAIQKQTGCIIELIYADAAVAATYTIKNDGKTFIQKLNEGKYTPKGGGGTNFIPAVELAKTYKPAVVIYLTDGEGTFPTTTYGMNLLWVISTDIIAPIGKTIHLKIR